MHLTCKCLNVSIKTRGNELKQFKINDEILTDIEKLDEFFQEPLAMAIELENITKEQSGLIASRNIGSWVVNRCINCSMYTHAVNREHGAALVLINTNIISSADEIYKLKSSPNYSSIYRITIDQNKLDDNDQQIPTKYSVSELSNTLQIALTSLQQQLEQSVQRKASIIEESIRKYTAEQYQLLEQFREQAHVEHRVLGQIICTQETTKTTNNSDKKIVTTDSTNINFVPPVDINMTTIKSNNSDFMSGIDLDCQLTPKKVGNLSGNGGSQKKVKRVKSGGKNENFDAEAMFDLEGMDDTSASEHPEASEDEEDDTDDSGQDEGIHIPRGQRGGHPTLAKSLPVCVPNFSSFVRNSSRDFDDDQLSMDPRDPKNIRASIKALAKSVHGDAVFGDLPRPRFSTQI